VRIQTALSAPPPATLARVIPRLFILIPVYNEAAALAALLPSLLLACESEALRGYSPQLVFVDDGSVDDTFAFISAQSQTQPRIHALRLSRNFGKEAALLAGFDAIAPAMHDHDAVIVMDGDGQDPPALLTQLTAHAKQTRADIVIALRAQRASEGAFKRLSARLFQWFMRTFSDVPMPRGASDCCYLRAPVVRAITQMREFNRFFKGMTEWVGFRVETIAYDQAFRAGGETKFGVRKMGSYALTGVLGYSKAPLRAVTWMGLALALIAFTYGAIIVARTLLFGEPVRGYPTLMVTILGLGGVQLVALGIIGEYLGRTLDEVRRRPVYVVAENKTALPSAKP
jgi:polyisoprenyl-phosphate glycosyltransferase